MQTVHPLLKRERTPFRPAQIPQWLHPTAAIRAKRIVGRAALMRKIRQPAFAAPVSFSLCFVFAFDFAHIQLI
jgi:hypothetical protein